VSQKTFQNQRLKTQGISWQNETPATRIIIKFPPG